MGTATARYAGLDQGAGLWREFGAARRTNGTHVKANGGKEVADVKMRESASESAEIERTDDANVSNHSQHAGGNAKNGKSAFSSENVRYKLNDERGKSSLQTEKVKITRQARSEYQTLW